MDRKKKHEQLELLAVKLQARVKGKKVKKEKTYDCKGCVEKFLHGHGQELHVEPYWRYAGALWCDECIAEVERLILKSKAPWLADSIEELTWKRNQ